MNAATRRNKRKPTGIKLFAYTLVMILAVVVIITSGPGMLSRQIVEVQMKIIADFVAKQGEGQDQSATLTYGDISMQGFGYDKKAAIANPVLSITRKAWYGQDTLSFSTPKMLMGRDKLLPGGYVVEFPEPVVIASNGAQTATITFEKAPQYAIARNAVNGDTEIVHQLHLPGTITVNYKQEPGAKPQGPLTISFDPKPVLVSRQFLNSGQGEAQVSITKLVLTDAAEATSISVGSLSSNIKLGAPENGKMVFDVNVMLADIGVKEAASQHGPYSFKLSMNGLSGVDANKQPTGESDVTIRELTLGTDKYSVNATGKFSNRMDDSLPFGSADIAIKNFAELRSGKELSPQTQNILIEALNKVTGADVSVMDDVNFTLTREKLGQFAIGHATFEDIAALIVANAMMSGSTLPGAITPPPTTSDTTQSPADAPASGTAAPVTPALPVPSEPVAPAAPAPAPAQ